MPRVITGTSAGGLVAALVCTRTDSELKQLVKPELANKITACEDPFSVWFKRAWKTGARFDSVTWAKKVRCVPTCPHMYTRYLTFSLVLVVYARLIDIPRSIYAHWAYTERICRSCRPPLAHETPQLYHCSRHCHLVCAARVRGCTRHPESSGSYAETQGRTAGTLELGKQVQGRVSSVCANHLDIEFMRSVLIRLPVLTFQCRASISISTVRLGILGHTSGA